MKKPFIATAVLLASLGATLSNASDGLFETTAVPLDPYLQGRANAVKVYDLPPRIAISLGCEQELADLEVWMLKFAARTGLTLGEVEYMIGMTTPH